ncbi:MAG: DUF308 domain-containing protein [Oscillospiraceae bacterium]|nr:DUF308 domain-containing protein [Oscillospiraceae bacterium]
MQTFRRMTGAIIMALCEIAVGILLLVEPVGFTAGIICVCGVLLVLSGLVQVISYFRASPEESVRRHGLTKGLLCIVGGLFCALRAQWFIATFPVLTILYGCSTLVLGIHKIGLSIDLARLKSRSWKWALLDAIVTLICAIVILCNPFTTTAVLWIFVAVSLLVEGLIDFISAFFVRKSTKDVDDDTVIDAEYSVTEKQEP